MVRRSLALIALLLLLLAAGCGKENDEPDAEDPPVSTSEASDDWSLVTLESASNAGGERAVPEVLTDDASVNRFLSQFGPSSSGDPAVGLVQKLQTAIDRADVEPGQVLVAAVVDVSCTPADDVDVAGEGKSLQITATFTEKPDIQCLVPVTSVAVVSMSADRAPAD